MSDRLEKAFHDVANEVQKAMAKHGPMTSPHEGRSVIREECDELWSHVMHDTGASADARKEAIQVAAMGIRYCADVVGGPLPQIMQGVRATASVTQPVQSAHEGHAHIMDHFASLFSLVASGGGSGHRAAAAAIGLSAAAIRYAADLCGES